MFRSFICWFVFFFFLVLVGSYGEEWGKCAGLERQRWANLRKRFRHENNGRKDALRIFRFLKGFFFFFGLGTKQRICWWISLTGVGNWQALLGPVLWGMLHQLVISMIFFPYGILFTVITFCPFKDSNITSPSIYSDIIKESNATKDPVHPASRVSLFQNHLPA